MTKEKNNRIPIIVILVILVVTVVVVVNNMIMRPGTPQELMGVIRSVPKVLDPFELHDQHGVSVSGDIFRGKWSFVFFGYTSCPDICPTTLHVLKDVTGKLALDDSERASSTQVIFISVDPDRDTTPRLAEYMEFFDKGFVGVTGDRVNIDNITRQFGAGYAIEKANPDAPDQYLVGHTSAIFLVSPEARLVASFSQPHSSETITRQYTKIRSYM